MIVAVDCETTGTDHFHGTRPFFVSSCTPDGTQRYWDWPVDPLTRTPAVPPGDVAEIKALLAAADRIIGQNFKFDSHALRTVGIPNVPWKKLEDTLIAGHLLASNQPHDLTSMALHYLGLDVEPLERALEAAIKEGRRLVQQAQLRRKRATATAATVTANDDGDALDAEEAADDELADWAIAKEGLTIEGRAVMPSAGAKTWRYDYWLPRALAAHLGHPVPADHCAHAYDAATGLCAGCGGHHWWAVLRDYANADTAVTVKLWEVMEAEIARRGLGKIYRAQMRLVPITYRMELRGVTAHAGRLRELEAQYRAESAAAGARCVEIAAGLPGRCPDCEGTEARVLCTRCGGEGYCPDVPYELTLPKGASPNDSIRDFCFEVLKLPPVRNPKAKTDKPSLDKTAIQHYLDALPAGSRQLEFVQILAGKRKRDSYLAYMDGYQNYWIKVAGPHHVLHPNLNLTGTDTLRCSSNNPNEQNISKKGLFEGDTKTLRYLFGPGPGREWWSLDYENIELRIPAYESGERAMIELFERPDEPPYYGSYHLLNAGIIYPDLFRPLAGQKGAFKKKYAATWYQWCKNAGFALIYGCQEAKFDATAHKAGAYRLLRDRLPALFRLNDHWVAYANRHGRVETLPDRDVDPDRGYPILCGRTEYGRISPTVPLNYHVQSTAMQCTRKAMIRVDEFLARLNKGLPWAGRRWPGGYFVAMQVHDELVLDLPAGGAANLPVVREVRRLMELSGGDIGVPLRTSTSYHPVAWSLEQEPAA